LTLGARNLESYLDLLLYPIEIWDPSEERVVTLAYRTEMEHLISEGAIWGGGSKKSLRRVIWLNRPFVAHKVWKLWRKLPIAEDDRTITGRCPNWQWHWGRVAAYSPRLRQQEV